MTHFPFITIPLVGAPMAGATSAAMVARISDAGGLGSLPLGYVRPEKIAAAMHAVRTLTQRPFAANLFVDTASPFDAARVSRARDALRPYRERLGLPEPVGVPVDDRISFAAQCAALFAERPRVVSFTFGIPEPGILARARACDIYTIGTANTVAEALALEAAGVDAICAQGFEAGGHHGSFIGDPADAHVGTLALVAQVVSAVRIPVLAAGGIGDGRAIAAVLALGAAAAQVGSAFLLADESAISQAYRARLHHATTRFTTAFSGRIARGVRNRFMDELEHSEDIAPYPDQNALTRDIRDAAAVAGEAAYLSLWAGQAISLAIAESTLAIVGRLMRETGDALETGLALFRGFPGREAYADVPMEHTDGALAHDRPASSSAPTEPVVASEAHDAPSADAPASEPSAPHAYDAPPADPTEDAVTPPVAATGNEMPGESADAEPAVEAGEEDTPLEPPVEETASADMPVQHAPIRDVAPTAAGAAAVIAPHADVTPDPATPEHQPAEQTTAAQPTSVQAPPHATLAPESAAQATPAPHETTWDAAAAEAVPVQRAQQEIPTQEDSAPASAEHAAAEAPSEPSTAATATPAGAPRTLGADPAVVERKRKAQESWERAVAAHAGGDIIEGTVTSAVKGGLLVDVDGVRGFLPASQASPGPGIAIETLVKQKLPLKIIDVDATRKRVVVSHRRAAESAKRAARSTLLRSLAIGQRFEATVVRLAEFGAFVDIGSGVDGLVPMSELAFERVEKVEDLLKVGDTFDATVIRIDEGGRKIALSRKGALPDPWRDHAAVVRIGATIEGTVVGKEPRLQVEIAPGIVGAVRESDADPAEYEIGEKIEVSVRNLDRRTRRITLTTLHGAAAAIVTNPSKQTGGFATLGEELLARTKKR